MKIETEEENEMFLQLLVDQAVREGRREAKRKRAQLIAEVLCANLNRNTLQEAIELEKDPERKQILEQELHRLSVYSPHEGVGRENAKTGPGKR